MSQLKRRGSIAAAAGAIEAALTALGVAVDAQIGACAPIAKPGVQCQARPSPDATGVQMADWLTDVAGRQVAKIIDGTLSAGEHEQPFRAERLASGVYYFNLRYEGKTVRQPCVLIR